MLQVDKGITIRKEVENERNPSSYVEFLPGNPDCGLFIHEYVVYSWSRFADHDLIARDDEFMPIEIERIRAICFDVDGTLSDTDDQFVQKILKILNPLTYLIGRRNIHSFARRIVMFTEGPGNWIYRIVDRFGWDGRMVALGDRIYELGIGETGTPFVLIDGVHEMLVRLHERFPLSIISIRGMKSTYRFLFQFELLPFFTGVATGQTCQHTKPYPDPILWAAQKMGVPATACVMVGDTVSDILAGKNAGAQTVGVLCGFGEEKELRNAGADLIIKNTPDLLDLLTQ